VNGIQEEYQTSEEIIEAFTKKLITETVAVSFLQKLSSEAAAKKAAGESSTLLTREGRIPAALTLLQRSFALYTRKNIKKEGSLPAFLQALVFFNIQWLRRLQLIDQNVSYIA
jgi:folate-binding Fe-S cluster repair protein YgfZ